MIILNFFIPLGPLQSRYYERNSASPKLQHTENAHSLVLIVFNHVGASAIIHHFISTIDLQDLSKFATPRNPTAPKAVLSYSLTPLSHRVPRIRNGDVPAADKRFMHPFSILTLAIFVAGYITARWDLVTRLYELAIFAWDHGVVVRSSVAAEKLKHLLILIA